MTRKQAEARVVRAAMRWYRWINKEFHEYVHSGAPRLEVRELARVCAALARKEKK